MLSKKSIAVLGSKVAYLDEGSHEHPAVLLIHGFPESSLLWKDIVPGAGHFIHIEAADAVSQIVKDHFERLQE